MSAKVDVERWETFSQNIEHKQMRYHIWNVAGMGLSYQMSEFSGPNSWGGMALILKAHLLILIR